MADPLSITASIIAILGAAEGVTKAITSFKHIQNAPTKLLALLNEVADLTVVLRSVQTFVRDQNSQNLSIPRDQLKQLSNIVDRAKDEILRLENLIEYSLVKPNSTPESIQISSQEWLKAKPKILKFQQSLRDIRLNITTHMTLINSYVLQHPSRCMKLIFDSSYQSRIGLVIAEIRSISGLIQVNQQTTLEAIGQYTHTQLELLSDVKSGRADLRRLLEQESQPLKSQELLDNKEPTTALERHPRTVRVRAYVHKKAPCKPSCHCTCHITKTIRSSRLLRHIMGVLFINYSGNPFWAGNHCTTIDCTGSLMFQGSIQYFFPRRQWARALYLNLLMNSYSDIRASLAVRRIVASGAEIFRLNQAGDIDGMKRLFKLGLASPVDTCETGTSLLDVRTICGQKEIANLKL